TKDNGFEKLVLAEAVKHLPERLVCHSLVTSHSSNALAAFFFSSSRRHTRSPCRLFHHLIMRTSWLNLTGPLTLLLSAVRFCTNLLWPVTEVSRHPSGRGIQPPFSTLSESS